MWSDFNAVRGQYLWVSRIDDVTNQEWDLAWRQLPPEDSVRLHRSRVMRDRQLSLISLLLQKLAVREYLGVGTDTGISIARTSQGKPYPLFQGGSLGSWNFNASHHSGFAALVASANCLVGVDVVERRPTSRRSYIGRTSHEWVQLMSVQLTLSEKSQISCLSSEAQRLDAFFALWALKESYIKAIGEGLGFPLNQISFVLGYPKSVGCVASENTLPISAVAYIRGKIRNDWSFQLISLDANHLLAVARGPLHDAERSFHDTLCSISMDIEMETIVYHVPPCGRAILSDTVAMNVRCLPFSMLLSHHIQQPQDEANTSSAELEKLYIAHPSQSVPSLPLSAIDKESYRLNPLLKRKAVETLLGQSPKSIVEPLESEA